MPTELSAEQQAVNDEAIRHRAALAAYAFCWIKDWSAANSHVDQARAAMLQKWDAPPDLEDVHGLSRKVLRLHILIQKRSGANGNGNERSADSHADSDADLNALDAMVAMYVEGRLHHYPADVQEQRALAIADALTQLMPEELVLLNDFMLRQLDAAYLAEQLDSSPAAINERLQKIRQLLMAAVPSEFHHKASTIPAPDPDSLDPDDVSLCADYCRARLSPADVTELLHAFRNSQALQLHCADALLWHCAFLDAATRAQGAPLSEAGDATKTPDAKHKTCVEHNTQPPARRSLHRDVRTKDEQPILIFVLIALGLSAVLIGLLEAFHNS